MTVHYNSLKNLNEKMSSPLASLLSMAGEHTSLHAIALIAHNKFITLHTEAVT